MVDRVLRPWKARAYAPLLGPLAAVPPDAVTAVGAAVGLAAAAAAAVGRFEWALAGWWLNRWLDGLDGELARAAAWRGAGGAGAPSGNGAAAGARGAASLTRGAYVDLMADLVVYAAVPLGLAAGAAGNLTGAPLATPGTVWAAAAFALAAFYLNLGSWALLAPALGADEPAGDPDAPGLPMPAGLMEGAETIVAFSLALAWPAWAPATLAVIGGLTLASALQRSAWGMRRLAGRAS